MKDVETRKIIMISLAGLLIGSLLYIFGASIKNTILPLCINYFIALFLFISSFLTIYHQYRQSKYHIYLYIMILTIILIILITFATILTII